MLTMRPWRLKLHPSWWVLLFVCCWIFSNIGGSNAAQEDEKNVLLDFKTKITKDPLNVLESWRFSDESPCNWTGISCDITGNVERITLRNMQLNGTISSALTNLKHLRALSLSRNGFTGPIPVELAKIGSLWKLNLSYNAFSGPIPPDLGNLSSLRLLDLSGNFLGGTIPSSLFKYCLRLRYIALSNNSLSGPIPTEISQCGRLVGFDFSFNNLNGNFPQEICIPESMAYVSLKRNSLTGFLPRELGNCRSLQFLDLGGNTFTGTLPYGLLSLSNLWYFSVDQNTFSQGLLPDILTLQNLKHFKISNNKLSGIIPPISKCSNSLEEIDLSANNFTGQIPGSLSSCKSLEVLDLSNNKINGDIPSVLGRLISLKVLRLGGNNIDGIIPSEIGNIEFLQILDLHDLHLRGAIPEVLPNCRFLLELDLSDNALDGPIPQKLYNITYLSHLDLHGNRFNGSIPSNLGNLSYMKYLDLSDNLLTGMIPPSLGKMRRLSYFNVSFNRLQGRIPDNSVMRRFGRGFFVGNAELCGAPLDTICMGPASTPIMQPTVVGKRTRLLSVSAIIAIVAAAVIAVGVCLITLINVRALRRKKTELLVYESTPPSPESNLIIGKLVLFSKSLPSKYEDWEAGTKALLDKECLIGGGAIGTVYKATFDGGLSIAVKKLETLGRIKVQEEFEQEIGRLGNLRHPNLVALQGYYWSSTMQLILSDFIPNGNLYHHLHEEPQGCTPLCWGRRFRIALGTAKALAYLHHDCKPQILHFDIKSTNILIDEDFEPHLSDYGLGKLLPMLDSYISSRKFHTAVGYVAPELACQSLRLTDKCDVYSLGVILLELITGRRPVESSESEVVILCEFVRASLEQGEGAACIDPNLQQRPENEIMQVLKLGLICTAQTPSRRPSMAEVVQVLESIKPNSELR